MDNQPTPKAELLTFVPRPSRPPATSSSGIVGWLKKNLFGSFWNSLLTVSVFALLFLLLKPFLE